jgi:hypothetical protein
MKSTSESVQREIATLRAVGFVFLALSVVGGVFMVLPAKSEAASPMVAASALGELKAIQTAQVLYRVGDKDGDGLLQYASSLEALRLANTEGEPDLIDGELASGTKEGYRFTITNAGSEVFTVNADPCEVSESDVRYFGANMDGQVFFSTTGPVRWNPDGSSPDTRVGL